MAVREPVPAAEVSVGPGCRVWDRALVRGPEAWEPGRRRRGAGGGPVPRRRALMRGAPVRERG